MKKLFWLAAAIALTSFAIYSASTLHMGGGLPLGVASVYDQRAVRELDEIIRSKNDNDPRLDKDFNALSTEAKLLFRKRYAKFPRESRNERGTIIYLLGKNMSSAEDWQFLRDVAGEPPCLSLADCDKAAAISDGENLGDDVTLAYPSLVALKVAQAVLEKDPGSKEARHVFEAGLNSRTPAVSRLALKLGLQVLPQKTAPAKSAPPSQP